MSSQSPGAGSVSKEQGETNSSLVTSLNFSIVGRPSNESRLTTSLVRTFAAPFVEGMHQAPVLSEAP